MSISLHPDTPDGRTMAAAEPSAAASVQGVASESTGTKIRSRLFTKYVALFVAVVAVALLSNGIFEVFFYYREHKASLIRIQHEQAEAAAAKISQFIKEIESQLGWTTQLPWSAGSLDNRRFDALRLLRQVPAITELAQIDSTGKERLRVSRLAMDVVDSGLDLSKDPKFTEAVAKKVYYGPVYFRRESEPYMTLSLAGTRKDAGVSIAEVNLKLIWDVVSQIKVGEHGHAYVVGSQGRLIAHPDISLVLRNTDMSKLVQVHVALEEQAAIAKQQDEAAAALAAAQAASGVRPSSQPVQSPPPPRVANPATDSCRALEHPGPGGADRFCADLAAALDHVRRIAGSGAYASLYAALQRLAAVLLRRIDLRGAGRNLPRPSHGRPDPGVARRRRADRRRRFRPAHLDQDRRRTGRACQPVQRHGRALAGIICRPREQGRAAHGGADGIATAADRDSEVLESISSSAGELEPVFQKMLENATRICGAKFGTMTLYEDGGFRTMAVQCAAGLRGHPALQVIRPHPEAARHRRADASSRSRRRHQDPDAYIEGNPNVRALRISRERVLLVTRADAQGK
jgi:hypothetical protein